MDNFETINKSFTADEILAVANNLVKPLDSLTCAEICEGIVRPEYDAISLEVNECDFSYINDDVVQDSVPSSEVVGSITCNGQFTYAVDKEC